MKIPFAASDELQKEMAFFVETNDGEKIFGPFKTREDLIRHVEQSFEYQDIALVAQLFKPCRVLDVGVGFGLTSAYLALKGFEVTCVEPSLKACEDMERNFARLGIQVAVVNATGEVLANIGQTFDLVVFFSSLHHCDNVHAALSGARTSLRHGGKIFLFEPVLKCYRTKAWFYQTLKDHPEQIGHYGGNEHIYRYGEYVQFLRKAGFKNIIAKPSLTYSRIPKRAPWDNALRYAVKKVYFALVRDVFMRISPLKMLLTRLSLINPVLVADR